MRVQNINLFFAAIIFFTFSVFGQDKFNTTRLTFDPAQEGFPTWSPDGRSIVHSYHTWSDSLGKNGLWKISLDTRETKHILSGIAEHPQWSPDGRFIVFDADTGNSMRMIEVEGGNTIMFLPDTVHINKGGLPCWSPDASQIAFKDSKYSLCVYDIKTGKINRIFYKEGMLLLPGCWSKDGESILIALMDRQTRKSTMWKISRDGKEKQQITGHHEGFYRYLALSPDGSLLTYTAKEGKYLGLWIMPAEGGKSIPLTITNPGHNESPAWSPDGKQLAFTSTRSGNFDIWIMDVDVEQLKAELLALNK